MVFPVVLTFIQIDVTLGVHVFGARFHPNTPITKTRLIVELLVMSEYLEKLD
jgi:hypothetical protein